METSDIFLSKKLSAGFSLEQGLLSLKENGFTPIDAIKAIQVCLEVTLSEAKAAFSKSSAWQAEIDAANQLHEEIIKTIKNTSDA